MDKLDDEMDQLAEGASDKEILHKKQVYRKNREKIMKEEYTGFVWIYYQK